MHLVPAERHDTRETAPGHQISRCGRLHHSEEKVVQACRIVCRLCLGAVPRTALPRHRPTTGTELSYARLAGQIFSICEANQVIAVFGQDHGQTRVRRSFVVIVLREHGPALVEQPDAAIQLSQDRDMRSDVDHLAGTTGEPIEVHVSFRSDLGWVRLVAELQRCRVFGAIIRLMRIVREARSR